MKGSAVSQSAPALLGADSHAEPSAAWRTIDTAPVDGTRILALQAGEIWHAYGDVNRSGRRYFVRRTHERCRSCSWAMLVTDWHGEIAERKVILTEEPDNYEFNWVAWSRDYDFAPTHWAPLPSPPLSAQDTTQQSAMPRETNEKDQRIKELEEALRKIATGTEDLIAPYRALGLDQVRRIARQALSTSRGEKT